MILPSFSIRTIMYVAAALAVVALVAGQAVDGTAWAICVTVAVGSLVVCWVVYALFYAIAAAFARVVLSRESNATPEAYYPAPRSETSAKSNHLTPMHEDI